MNRYIRYIRYSSIIFHEQRRVSGGQPYYIITTQSVHLVLQPIKIIITKKKRRKTTSDPVTITAASGYKIRVTHRCLDHSRLAITHTYAHILYARTATVLYPFCSPKTATYTSIGWVHYTCRRRIIFDRRQCTRHMK